MKNVLKISPSLYVKGGITSVIKGYLESDLSKMHNFYLIASHVDGHKIAKLIRAIAALVEIIVHFLTKDADIVHIHVGDVISFKRKFFFFKITKFFKKKVIYHNHGAEFIHQYQFLSTNWKKRVQWTFENVDLVICLSESWRNGINQIAPGAKIMVVPNAISLPVLFPKKPKHFVNLTFLGLIGPRKGIFDLLKVVEKLINNNYPIKLTIGGNGEVKRLLRKLQDLRLSNNVQYLGWVDDKKRDNILRQTDIFILPSYGEGMPMAILEAMAYSVPVISTYVGGIPELVLDGQTGYLIKPGDLDELYRKISFMIENMKHTRALGRRGREVVAAKHNIQNLIHQMNGIYNSL
jgi:glycosyltransferase involved in cell wall biosynthesis